MRLAVFSDVHGNLPALLAALSDMRAHGADALVCLGDVAMDGPWPAECVRHVHALSCPVVRGNADRLLLEPAAPFQAHGFDHERELHDIGVWSAAQLGEDDRRIVAAYRSSVAFPDLLCFHGSPERDNEVLDVNTPDARLEELRAVHGTHAAWVGGHTHVPLERHLGSWTLLNPGSVGLPFEARGDRYVNIARAEYLLLDRTGQDWVPTFRRVPYDLDDIRRGLLASGMPHARWAAAEWVEG